MGNDMAGQMVIITCNDILLILYVI